MFFFSYLIKVNHLFMFTRKLGSAIGHSQGVGGSFIAYDRDTRAGCGGRCSDDGRRPLLPSLSLESCLWVCVCIDTIACTVCVCIEATAEASGHVRIRNYRHEVMTAHQTYWDGICMFGYMTYSLNDYIHKRTYEIPRCLAASVIHYVLRCP